MAFCSLHVWIRCCTLKMPFTWTLKALYKRKYTTVSIKELKTRSYSVWLKRVCYFLHTTWNWQLNWKLKIRRKKIVSLCLQHKTSVWIPQTLQNISEKSFKRFYGHVLVQVFFKLCLRRNLRQEHKIVRSLKVVLLAVYQVLYKTVVKGKPLVKVFFFWVVVEFLDFVKSGGLF